MFDPEEARKAVARVKDRSIGPDTVHDLSALLEKATTRVAALQGEVSGVSSALATERQQITNKLAEADRAVLQAIRDRDAAIETERQHSQIVALALALDQAVTRITEAEAEVAADKVALAEARTTCALALDTAAKTQAMIAADRDAALKRDAAHHATLAKIADLAWWERLTGVALAREAIDGHQ